MNIVELETCIRPRYFLNTAYADAADPALQLGQPTAIRGPWSGCGSLLDDMAWEVACVSPDGEIVPEGRSEIDGFVDVESEVNAAVVPVRERDDVVSWHLNCPVHADTGLCEPLGVKEVSFVAQKVGTIRCLGAQNR